MNLKKTFRKFWYNKIYWKIYNYFHYKSPIFIGSLNIFKIYKDWWKARKDFHRPFMKIYKMKVNENFLGSDYFFIETSTYNKWLYFNVERCGYKYKFREIRFENVPYICIIWRNKTKWIIGLEAPLYDYHTNSDTYWRDNDLYWEGILTYNYEYNKDIIKTFKNNIWQTMHELKDIDEITNYHKKLYIYHTLIGCLKNKAAEKIIKFYKEKYEKTKG